MGRFFFDLGTAEGVFADERGAEFETVEEAYLNACDAALEITTQVLSLRRRMVDWRFEILDAQRRPLMEVTFEEIQQRGGPPPGKLEQARLWAALDETSRRTRQQTRELRQGFDEARETLHSIRKALRRLGGEEEEGEPEGGDA